MIDEQTMRSWLRRVDEEGEDALIQISEPVNKFADFVRYLVNSCRWSCRRWATRTSRLRAFSLTLTTPEITDLPDALDAAMRTENEIQQGAACVTGAGEVDDFDWIPQAVPPLSSNSNKKGGGGSRQPVPPGRAPWNAIISGPGALSRLTAIEGAQSVGGL